MMKIDLSELPIAPHQYRIAGIALLGAGFVILIIGLLLTIGGQSQRAENSPKSAADECAQRINQLGLKAIPDGNRIRIIDADMNNAVQLLAESSQAVTLCPDWLLNQYCLGSGCKPVGLSMILQHTEPPK